MLVPEGADGDTGSKGPVIKLVWDSAPFNTIYTLCEWNDVLYAGGRYDEKIYRSHDGVEWSVAFDQKTTYAWESSMVFNGSIYFGSTEDISGKWTVMIWRSSDGITLEKVFESDPSVEKIMPGRRFSIMNENLLLPIRGGTDGIVIGSSDGLNWETIFISEEYTNPNDIFEFNDAYYLSVSSKQNGGALFRASDGENWETIRNWTQGNKDWHGTVGHMVIFEDELYLAHNGNKENTWVEILKSSDGENFTEVWHGDRHELNYPEFAIYGNRLYLTMSGLSSENLGGEIWVFDGEDFSLLLEGNDFREHQFHGRAIFKGSLYIGGGSGKAGSGNAVLYRIYDPYESGPYIEVAWNTAPFGTVFVLTEFQDFLYAAGRWNERIYRSADGDIWSLAFPNRTTYSWQNAVVFKDTLYIVSAEGSGEIKTTILWRSTDGFALNKIIELENTTSERPSFGIFNDTLFMGVETYLGENISGCLYRSMDGVNWERIFTTNEGRRFQVFTIFNEAMYFTMSGLYCGGTIFSTTDGENFEMTAKWNDNLEYGENGAYGLCVFDNELYITLNSDGNGKLIRVLKSNDGEQFEEIWYSTEERLNAAKLCVFMGRLYLYICGKGTYSVGTQIRYFEDDEFKLLNEGDPAHEHTLLRHAVFKDALYIGGGGGQWMSHDAIIYRILDPKPFIVTSSQPEYRQGDSIIVTASYTEATNISFEIVEPGLESHLIQTRETDDLGICTIEFKLTLDDPVGTWTVFATNDRDLMTASNTFVVLPASPSPPPPPMPVLSILELNVPEKAVAGDTLKVNFTIMNTLDSDEDFLLVVQMKDPANICFNPVVGWENIHNSTTQVYSLSVQIPETAETGPYFLQGQLLTDFPRSGGFVIDHETTEVLVE